MKEKKRRTNEKKYHRQQFSFLLHFYEPITLKQIAMFILFVLCVIFLYNRELHNVFFLLSVHFIHLPEIVVICCFAFYVFVSFLFEKRCVEAVILSVSTVDRRKKRREMAINF